MPGTLATNWLDPFVWGTTTGGAAGAGETTATLGTDRLDTRVPPDQYHVGGLQISQIKNLLLSMTAWYAGGTRLKVLTQTANPFSASETGLWVDTNGNPRLSSNGVSSTIETGNFGSNVASASTITLTNLNHHITGTTTISTINVPYAGFAGTVCLIPDAIWATNTAGNIALASTAVVNKALFMTYDSSTSKFYPSY